MPYYVYVLANRSNTTIYVGVTNDLARRVYEHKNGHNGSFTSQYHVDKLVYFEEWKSINDAIEREKQIKSWSRKRKNEMVDAVNPTWEEIHTW